MKKCFFVTGYIGEGAKRMLLDLKGMGNVRLIDQVIENKFMRFQYYLCSEMTDRFSRCHFLKKFFYSWFTVLRIHYREDAENYILFFNSGFCRELDLAVVERLKKKNKNKNIKLILYIVDPMVGFSAPEHMEIIRRMDRVYSINKADCHKYGFLYYPLVYSKEPDKDMQGQQKIHEKQEMDLYYLGSGGDRTSALLQIHQKCVEKDVKADFHVLDREQKQQEEGINFHESAVSYAENVERLKQSNCILEIMHEDFDNPTQRYSEAVVYNKKLLTNNKKTVTFEFYDPRYMQVFSSVEEIDMTFVKKKEDVNYGYREEFSPRLLIRQIAGMQKEEERDR